MCFPLSLSLFVSSLWNDSAHKNRFISKVFVSYAMPNHTRNQYAFHAGLLTLEYSEQFLRVKKRLELFYSVGIKYTIHKSQWLYVNLIGVCVLLGFIGAGYKIHRLLYLMFRWLLEPLQLNISEISITNALETISNGLEQCSVLISYCFRTNTK